jgi:predicted regulator of Ras-like GTPase activity (Roadblock/LC7/MglB family)
VFTKYLKHVVDNVDGGVGGLIMGLDGIQVETYVPPTQKVDINTIGMEFSFILTQIKKASEILQLGTVHEIAIKAEQMTLVIRMLTEDYFMAIALRSEGNLGKCRFLMRVAAPKLIAEL